MLVLSWAGAVGLRWCVLGIVGSVRKGWSIRDRRRGSIYAGPTREGTGVVDPSADRLEEMGEFCTCRDESICSGPACEGNASVGLDDASRV